MEVSKEMIIKKTKVRENVQGSISEDFYHKFDERVKRLLRDAKERAQLNGRKTLMDKDV